MSLSLWGHYELFYLKARKKYTLSSTFPSYHCFYYHLTQCYSFLHIFIPFLFINISLNLAGPSICFFFLLIFLANNSMWHRIELNKYVSNEWIINYSSYTGPWRKLAIQKSFQRLITLIWFKQKKLWVIIIMFQILTEIDREYRKDRDLDMYKSVWTSLLNKMDLRNWIIFLPETTIKQTK